MTWIGFFGIGVIVLFVLLRLWVGDDHGWGGGPFIFRGGPGRKQRKR